LCGRRDATEGGALDPGEPHGQPDIAAEPSGTSVRVRQAHVVLARVVDALPQQLWHPLNTYIGGRLHFCAGDGVRTVEWNNRVLAFGRRPFPHAWFDEELARLEAASEDDDA
jgi:hypothetical protein